MKTLKTLTAALLIVLSFSAFANEETKSEKMMMNYTVQKFINAVSHGQVKNIGDIFDKDVKMTASRNKQIVSFGKDDIVESLKFNKNTEQNCSTDFNFLEINPTLATVKVNQKYGEFTKVHLITIGNTVSGWKITNITTYYN